MMQYSLKRRITSDNIDKAVEGTFKRDRIIVMGALALVIVLSWGVRRQINMDCFTFELREYLAHLFVDIRRRACGIASAAV